MENYRSHWAKERESNLFLSCTTWQFQKTNIFFPPEETQQFMGYTIEKLQKGKPGKGLTFEM